MSVLKKNKLQREFTEKVTVSQGIIHKVCSMYCKDEEERKELFQEILIQLWKSYPSYRGDSQFSTWMYRVALNVALQQLRKRDRRKEHTHLTEDVDVIADVNDPQPLEEKKGLLYRAIEELNDIEKAIVMLYLEDKSNEEIAEIVGITQNYVRVKMTRLRKKLAKIVSP